MINFKNFKNTYLLLFLTMNLQMIYCVKSPQNLVNKEIKTSVNLKTGAERTDIYLGFLKGKNIAVVANQTSVIRRDSSNSFAYTHLIDSLISLKINISKVFAPEHGFRGKAYAGEIVKDGFDTKTKLPVISLYGKNKKPSAEHLKNIDLVVFDIQDVGTRFYTYISTLHYVMEACAELSIPVILLDRPNPNRHYIDGPVLEIKHKSFVGMHPVPVVYGMTIGEYGKMINGEKWLTNGIQCNLKVVPIKNYSQNFNYSLPIKPSPNLPNDKSINLYPSLCFFEGTNVSAGRGTDMQFQIYGSPFLKKTKFSFTPKANEAAKYPKHKGKICYGKNLQNYRKLNKINLSWLIEAYNNNTANKFFNKFFTKLAGTNSLQQQIEQGLSERKIRKSWEKRLRRYKKIRKKYLMY